MIRCGADHDGDAFLAESTSAVRRLTDTYHVLHVVSLQFLHTQTLTVQRTWQYARQPAVIYSNACMYYQCYTTRLVWRWRDG